MGSSGYPFRMNVRLCGFQGPLGGSPAPGPKRHSLGIAADIPPSKIPGRSSMRIDDMTDAEARELMRLNPDSWSSENKYRLGQYLVRAAISDGYRVKR